MTAKKYFLLPEEALRITNGPSKVTLMDAVAEGREVEFTFKIDGIGVRVKCRIRLIGLSAKNTYDGNIIILGDKKHEGETRCFEFDVYNRVGLISTRGVFFEKNVREETAEVSN